MALILQMKIAHDRTPSLMAFYFVQSYWPDRGRLVEGKLQRFASMEVALRAGRDAAIRAPAVHVFRVCGNPEVDYWEEAVTVAKFGKRASELRPG